MSDVSWNGRWHGEVEATPATLELRSEGGRIAGTVDAGGYRFSIEAVPDGPRTATGRSIDDQTGGAVEVRIELSDDAVTLTLPSLGGAMLVFRGRTETTVATGRLDAIADTAVPDPGFDDRDPALIGRWSRNETMISGGASLVIRHHLEIAGDGTYAKWTGQSSAGGESWGLWSGGGGAAARGRWRTQGNVVYAAEGAGWQPYAEYFVEGASLMLTFGNGTREVWHRG